MLVRLVLSAIEARALSIVEQDNAPPSIAVTGLAHSRPNLPALPPNVRLLVCRFSVPSKEVSFFDTPKQKQEERIVAIGVLFVARVREGLFSIQANSDFQDRSIASTISPVDRPTPPDRPAHGRCFRTRRALRAF